MFKTDLELIEIKDRPDFWHFGAPLVWEDEFNGEIVVPKGFITDMASIPHAIDWLPNLDRDGISRRPAALHDWLYGGDRTRGKIAADIILRAALIAEGMGNIGAFEYWYAVHAFGQSSWDDDNANLRQEHFYTPEDWAAYLAALAQPATDPLPPS
jgi:hypothetical protein